MIKKRFKFDELVIEDRVIEHLDNEFYEVAKSWFNFQNQWSLNIFKCHIVGSEYFEMPPIMCFASVVFVFVSPPQFCLLNIMNKQTRKSLK